ncbi:unnamed protein product [Mytilus coruscus]|uniref:Uncharacterized protein n=1 Tax=Mytilus coruscus TaxID=42192 RepID=A0A6J7ZY17_MYTCO|nr:unnamed protein product [Mytilus coruscus]
MEIIGNLFDENNGRNDIQNMKKTTKEIEQMESEFTDAENECQDYLIESKDDLSVASSASRVSRRANVNSGHKVESIHASEEKEIEVKPDQPNTCTFVNSNANKDPNLSTDVGRIAKEESNDKREDGKKFSSEIGQGYSEVAYDASKERLERKYGGQRRQNTVYIEELKNFKPMREGFAKDIEKYADLLYIAVVNLKEAGRFEESKNGSLYNKLQRKMTESMLSRYHRWIFESGKIESVEYLREWILQESEF